MAHLYAGILGPLAFLTSLTRGFMHRGGTESVLWSAWIGLLVFSVVGYVIGWVAERIVADSVRGGISAELAAEEAARASQPAAQTAAGA